ncbi:MAG: hypothetical protein JXA30_03510 [Deltaproteobacteria bacterium]|nr:hypothetical protein [Deltaproteobacteria bacterium]
MDKNGTLQVKKDDCNTARLLAPSNYRRRERLRPRELTVLLICFAAACQPGTVCRGGGAGDSTIDSGEEPLDVSTWNGVWGGARNPVDSLLAPEIADQSIRVVVNPTLGGERIRIRLSNTFGRYPLTIDSVHVAVSKVTEAQDGDLANFTAELQPGTNTALTFAGGSKVEIPPFSDSVSDSVYFPFSFGDNLAISFTVRGSADLPTYTRCCLGAFSTPPSGGDHSVDEMGVAFSVDITSRLGGGRGCPLLNAVDVLDPDGLGTVVAIGNSITEGTGSSEDGPFDRWPWLLARRINAAGLPLGVLNAGISGNTVSLPPETEDKGNLAFLLETGPERFDRDVLQQTNVRTAIIALGGNDLRFVEPNTDAIIAGIQNMVDRGHLGGIRVLLATIPPSTMGSEQESHNDDRRKINDWIRNNQDIEGWLPFDETLRDPENLDALQKQYDLDADNIHPEDAGRRALAAAIPLELL